MLALQGAQQATNFLIQLPGELPRNCDELPISGRALRNFPITPAFKRLVRGHFLNDDNASPQALRQAQALYVCHAFLLMSMFRHGYTHTNYKQAKWPLLRNFIATSLVVGCLSHDPQSSLQHALAGLILQSAALFLGSYIRQYQANRKKGRPKVVAEEEMNLQNA